jgi:hypothetical protein
MGRRKGLPGERRRGVLGTPVDSMIFKCSADFSYVSVGDY